MPSHPLGARVWLSAFVSGVLATGLASAQQPNPDREAYFGETHVHTGWSFDAYVFGNTKTSPADAYKYAIGEPIKHALGYDIKIETPLDWMGVTDHSEYVGVVQLANTPGSSVSKLPIGKQLIVKGPEDIQRVYLLLGGSMIENKPIKELVDPAVAGSVWKQNNQIADQYNKPGKFTAFCAYEWTSTPNSMNMHRNVFFKECRAVPPMPFSSLDSQNPEDLWNWMDGQRKAGHELLAISHNANLSDGHMYPIDVDSKGRPIDAAWAASRDRNERLIEIKQIKGQSETHPLLSPTDEFANYEIFAFLLGDPAGRTPTIPGSFARQALKDGIAMQETKGYNPYKEGFVGGSDSHNAGVPYRQNNFYGGHALNDGTIEQRMSGHIFTGLDVRLENPAGLTGVWAEQNTRASIFDAMQRRETFATSGPHIKVRFFGGWGFDKALVDQKDWVKTGYAKGVAMGGDLPPAASKAPTFALWAVKDPTSGNLDRIQVVKGWSKSGQSFEKIFDVAWSGDRKPDQVDRQGPGGRQHGRRRQRHVHEHDRSRGAEDGLDGPRVRSEPECLLLRPRPRDPDAALDHDPGQGARHRAARHGPGDRAGARLVLADLVHAAGGLARGRRNDRGGPEGEGRRASRRCGVDEPGRRQEHLVAQQRHGQPGPGPLRHQRPGAPASRRPEHAPAERDGESRPERLPGPPGSLPDQGRPYRERPRKHDASISPSTRSATSTWARDRTSSATPTTRSCPSPRTSSISSPRRTDQLGIPLAAGPADLLSRAAGLSRPRSPRAARPVPACSAWLSSPRHASSSPRPERTAPSRQIVLTLDDLRQLQIGFAAQWQRAPTEQEMIGLIENRIKEEILYREALAMGLDKDDTIVKRRMAQKMEFLAEDVSASHEPTTEELRAWFAKNTKLFAAARAGHLPAPLLLPRPPRPAAPRTTPKDALPKLAGKPAGWPGAAALGDPFMIPDYMADRTPEQVAKDFGPPFAKALFAQKPGAWTGPIESGYGWHLVYVDSLTPERAPAFEEVEPDVKTAWLAARKADAWDRPTRRCGRSTSSSFRRRRR